MFASIAFLKALSIGTSLVAAGGIASLTIFNVPSLQALPASRSLPQIRWLFSRDSHIFPTTAALSSAGFVTLAFFALPTGSRGLSELLEGLLRTRSAQGYTAAAALCISIAPFTALMVPTNFELIRMNEEKGGTRSERSAAENSGKSQKGGGATEIKDKAFSSIAGEGQASEFSDLSGPQGRLAARRPRKKIQKPGNY